MNPVWMKAFRDRDSLETLDYLLFSILFFAVPFFIVVSAEDSYILPKWVFLTIGALILFSVQFLKTILSKEFRVPIHPITALWVLYFVWQLIGVFYAESKILAWEQIIQSATVIVIVLIFQSLVFQDRRRLLAIAALLCFSGTLISIWTLAIDYLRVYTNYGDGVMDRLGDWRGIISTAGFGNTGHIADYVVLSFLATLAGYFFVQGKKRIIFFGVLLVIQSAALIVCWSVHSNLSLIISATFLAFLLIGRWRYEKRWKEKLKRLPPLIIAWAFVFIFFSIDQPLNPHHSKNWITQENKEQVPVEFGIFGEAFSSERWKEGGVTRQAIWLTSIGIIKENPILGTGTGNFTFAYPQVESESILGDPDLSVYAYKWTNAAHNAVLQTWSENGILGLLILVSIIVGSFIFSWRRLDNESTSNHLVLATALAMLVAVSLQAQMNFLLELPVSFLMVGLITSIPIVLPERSGYANLDMPVSRRFGPIELGAMIRNMRFPISLTFNFKIKKAFRIPVFVPFMILFLFLMFQSAKPLRASIIYKDVYEAYRFWQATRTMDFDTQIENSNLALDLNPNHREALSKRIEIAFASSKFNKPEEIEPYLESLSKQLSDYKVHLYRARLLDLKDDSVGALPHWRQTFKMDPVQAHFFPAKWKIIQDSEANQL